MNGTQGQGAFPSMGVRRFGRVNWLGLATLIRREIWRFAAVWNQTLLAPLITTALFLTIFNLAIGPARGTVMGQPWLHFLAPGLMMMTVIQNAFANTSSSIMVSKIQGNIVDTLMPPLSPAELIAGYVLGGVVRGMVVACAIAVTMLPVLGLGIAHPLWTLVFVLAGSVLMAGLGVVAGIHADTFDRMAALTNFVITPLAFLSGTFYSVEAVPERMQALLHLNPIFYLIDGLRHGVLGVSDSAPLLGLAVVLGSCVAVLGLAWALVRRGYRLKP